MSLPNSGCFKGTSGDLYDHANDDERKQLDRLYLQKRKFDAEFEEKISVLYAKIRKRVYND